jgi:oxygen-independent coproporphyrinogen-3 oxidase
LNSPIPLPRAVYIHVPFCAHRCGYCDFTLIARREDLVPAYLAAMEQQLSSVDGPIEIDTLFFGGGTPTHLEPDALDRLLRSVTQRFRLAPDGEFSVEANPTGLTDEKLDLLKAAGVNRISLGVQSFVPQELQLLERDHDVASLEDVVARLQHRWRNLSLDLIFAIPGQTLDVWRSNLDRAIALQPQHISTYGLTFERGTTFWSRQTKGTLDSVDQQIEREMYELSMSHLPDSGLPQYELSNFARPGFECRHNQVYWRGDEYWGFGPGAASYLGGVRRLNHRSVTTWIRRVQAGESPFAEEERNSSEDRAREAIMLGLRRTAGIDRSEFRSKFGHDPVELGGPASDRFRDQGWLLFDDKTVRLTREGCCFADSVIAEFL